MQCPTCRADVTLPARAMTGSTITPVLYADPLTSEAAELAREEESGFARLRHGLQQRAERASVWLKGMFWTRRRTGERALLIPVPSDDEV